MTTDPAQEQGNKRNPGRNVPVAIGVGLGLAALGRSRLGRPVRSYGPIRIPSSNREADSAASLLCGTGER